MPRRRSAAYNFRKDAPTRRRADAPKRLTVRWCGGARCGAQTVVFEFFIHLALLEERMKRRVLIRIIVSINPRKC